MVGHLINLLTGEKETRNRPSVAQRVPGGLGSQISWHLAREGDEVVSLMHRPHLPPGMFLILIFIRGWVDPRAIVRPEGNMSLKNPVTPPRIDPGTVRLVAQRLNYYVIPGPQGQRRLPHTPHLLYFTISYFKSWTCDIMWSFNRIPNICFKLLINIQQLNFELRFS